MSKQTSEQKAMQEKKIREKIDHAVTTVNDIYDLVSMRTRRKFRELCFYQDDNGDMVIDPKVAWRGREYSRLIRGEYEKCPALVIRDDGEKVIASFDYPEEHFVHASKSDPDMIAFTPSPEHGIADRQLKMRIGKYLKSHWYDDQHKPGTLSLDIISRLASNFRSELSDPVLKFATTRDEIKFVYKNGPSSCMTYSMGDYSTDGIHPCEVYASGDLAVAYITREGRVTARTVVTLKDKAWARVYGDCYLEKLLSQAGYKNSPSAFYGNRILLLENDHGDLIGPYMDCACTIKRIKGDNEYLMIHRDGEIEAQRTDGLISDNGCICAYCEEYRIRSSMYNDYNRDLVCCYCVDNGDVVWVNDELALYPVDHCDVVWVEHRDAFYLINDLDHYGITEYEGEYYDICDLVCDPDTGDLVPEHVLEDKQAKAKE